MKSAIHPLLHVFTFSVLSFSTSLAKSKETFLVYIHHNNIYPYDMIKLRYTHFDIFLTLPFSSSYLSLSFLWFFSFSFFHHLILCSFFSFFSVYLCYSIQGAFPYFPFIAFLHHLRYNNNNHWKICYMFIYIHKSIKQTYIAGVDIFRNMENFCLTRFYFRDKLSDFISISLPFSYIFARFLFISSYFWWCWALFLHIHFLILVWDSLYYYVLSIFCRFADGWHAFFAWN